jgi:hypothetical protein
MTSQPTPFASRPFQTNNDEASSQESIVLRRFPLSWRDRDGTVISAITGRNRTDVFVALRSGKCESVLEVFCSILGGRMLRELDNILRFPGPLALGLGAVIGGLILSYVVLIHLVLR